MKNLKIFFGACIIAMVLFTGCGQTSSKQKELELKERELALKEKEFALKVKEISETDSLVKKATQVPNNQTSNIKESTEVKLIINPQKMDNEGFGQITFLKNDKMLFCFVQKTQKGKIVINGTKYILTNCSNGENSYKLSGSEVIISANNLKDEGSGDCFHFNCPKVTITLNGVSTTISNVKIQDCLSFSL
ncbi:MAG: hypothetical protein NTZ69_18850 [Bacteroidia bacterium]|nr:hypothetical protein [Bacteroidia bacterium]